MSFGKLRASYGVNGNASGIGAYTLQGSYNTAVYNGNTGFLIGTLPNPGLRWEKTKTAEVGMDLSFFENRLNANFTYYNRLTSDKYAAFSLPSTTGFSSITNNNGKVDKVLNGRFNKKGALFFYFRKNTYVCNIITIPLCPKVKKICTQQTLL